MQEPEDDEQRRAAEVLGQVRAGVRQRQSELAALAGGEETKLRLLELRTLEFVEEPLAVSPRPVVGQALVFLRKASFHLLFKWWARPVLLRQNRFNQVASQLLHEMARRQERLAETLAATQRRLAESEELEGRLAELEGRVSAAGAAAAGQRPEGGGPS
jgi:hypothetical protein